jgi:biotin carboxyl carrier protein
MRYFVTVAERTVEVCLEGGRVIVDGKPMHAELAGTGALRHLLLDGRSHALLVGTGEARGQWTIELAGRRFSVQAVDERTRAVRAMTGVGTGARSAPAVRAPMPGLILRLEVTEGQSVAAGQGVVIMEAMKMENELRADGGGIVSHIRVVVGQAVEKGTVLVEFQAP